MILMYSTTKMILLTGKPKSGKSRMLDKLRRSLSKQRKIRMNGIISSELQFKKQRIGIKMKDIKKKSEILMAVKTFKNNKYNMKSKQFGSYCVDVNALENVALPVFDDLKGCNLLIIDEIGKMELLSNKFKKKIKTLFSTEQKFIILAIVPISNDVPLVEDLKKRSDTELIELSENNREGVYRKIRKRIINFVV